MEEILHPIQLASKRTGLSPHVIRVWEKRYGAVTPSRTESKRRLYSEQEITRLHLLHQLIQAGHRIGNIARLPQESLQALLNQSESEHLPTPKKMPTPPNPAESFVKDATTAIKQFHSSDLEETLRKASVILGNQGLLIRVIAPLAQKIGELWREGEITAAHEHFGSAGIRNFLSTIARPFGMSESAPVLIVATPAGQVHELGAILVSAAAVNLGWRVIYLGVSLPAAEIAGSAIQNNARAIALSLVYPEDDPNLPRELELLKQYLPTGIRILVGGRASASYEPSLQKIGAARAESLSQLADKLEWIRSNTSHARNSLNSPMGDVLLEP